MVSNGWAQLMKAWQISVTAGGRRSTTGEGKKKESPKPDGIPVPGKSPVADDASGDVPVELCSPCTSATNREQHPWEHLTEAWKSHPNLGDGVLAMADVQRQAGDLGNPWERRRVVSAPFGSLSPSFNHLLTRAGLFLRHSRHNFPRRAVPHPALAPPLGAARTPLPGRIVPPLLIVRGA